MRKNSLLFLGIIIVSLLPAFLFISDITVTASPDNVTGLSTPMKVSSEEENIDSFTVNPKSGRWDVTDTNTDNSIQNGQLNVISSNNGSGDSGYFANRALSSSDDKIEMRYQSLAQNQSEIEYFRDVLGDSVDFNEGDREVFVDNYLSPTNIIITNSIFSFVVDSSHEGILSYPLSITAINERTILKYTYKVTSSTIRGVMLVRNNIPEINLVVCDLIEDGNWHTDVCDLSSLLLNRYNFSDNNLRLRFGAIGPVNNETFYLDDVTLTNSLDYASHQDGAIENTWDWEDSLEYFYNNFGNVSDFDDGTTEQFYGLKTGLTNNGSNYLQLNNAEYFFKEEGVTQDFSNSSHDYGWEKVIIGDTAVIDYNGSYFNLNYTDNLCNFGLCVAEMKLTGLSINTDIYKYGLMEVYSSLALQNIGRFHDASSNFYCFESIFANTWTTVKCQFMAGWTGIESELFIYFRWSNSLGPSIQLSFNLIALYSLVSDIGIRADDLSIPASGPAGYDYFTMEFYSDVEIDQINIYEVNIDNVTINNICNVATGWSANTFALITCDLDLSVHWGAIELSLIIYFNFTNLFNYTNYVLINMIYLYNNDRGDREGFVGYSTEGIHAYTYVKPQGYLVSRKSDDLGAGDGAIRSPASLSISAEIFDIIIIKAKASHTAIIQTYDANLDPLGSTFTLTTSFQVFSINLSLDPNWAGIETRLNFRDASSGNLTLYEFDYILLINSEESEQKFVFGFYNQNSNQADLLNISHVWSNSTVFRWEVELFASDGSLNAYYYSVYQTNIFEDFFYYVKLTYNLDKSVLKLLIQFDNGTRILNINLNDFVVVDLTDIALFGLSTPPDVFFHSYSIFFGHAELYLDYVNAKFRSADWKQITSPNSAYWLHDNALLAKLGANIITNTNSTWRLNIPNLDVLSGSFLANMTPSETITDIWIVNTFITLYTVVPNSGLLEVIGGIFIEYRDATPAQSTTETQVNIFTADNPEAVIIYDAGPSLTDFGLDFQFQTSNERKDTILTLRAKKDASNSQSYFRDGSYFFNNSANDNTQEFVVEINYNLEDTWSQDAVVLLQFPDLSLKTKDIIGDVIKGVGSVINGFLQVILFPIFLLIDIIIVVLKFLADIIKQVWDIAVQLLLGALDSLGDLLFSIISNIIQLGVDLVNILTDVIDAIADIANAIWSSFVSVVDDIINAIIPFIVNILEAVWNGLVTLIDIVASTLVNIVVYIFTAVGLLFILVFVSDVLTFVINFLTFGFTVIVNVLIYIIANIVTELLVITTILLVYILILPISQSVSIGDWLELVRQRLVLDLTGGRIILGTSIPIPLGFVTFGAVLLLLGLT